MRSRTAAGWGLVAAFSVLIGLKRKEVSSSMVAPIINDVATKGGYELRYPLNPEIGPLPEKWREIIENTWGSKLDTFQFPASTSIQAAFDASTDTAKKMGWKMRHEDKSEFVIQAMDVTPLLRFKDDIVIKLTASGDTVLLDMRSKSRVGKGDLGKNAARIQAYLDHLRKAAGSADNKQQPAGGQQQPATS